VRLKVNQAVRSLIDEAGGADTTHVDVSIADVLHVETLDAEGEQNCTVCQVFDDHVLFAFVIAYCPHDVGVTSDVLNQQVICVQNLTLKSG